MDEPKIEPVEEDTCMDFINILCNLHFHQTDSKIGQLMESDEWYPAADMFYKRVCKSCPDIIKVAIIIEYNTALFRNKGDSVKAWASVMKKPGL